MKIRHLISSGGFYGAERMVVELAAYTLSRGHDVSVWVVESPGADAVKERLSQRGVPAELLKPGRSGLVGLGRLLGKRVGKEGIQVLHSHGYRTDVLATLIGLHAPVMRVATCHNWCSNSLKLRLYERLDKWVLKRFDRIVAVCPQLQQELAASGVLPSKIRVILNGIDFEAGAGEEERVAVRRKFHIEEGSLLIVRVGRLSEEKDNHRLLEAFAEAFESGGASLLFVGEGEEREALEEHSRRLLVHEKVFFAGYQRDVAPFLAAADIFVISSRTEGLPIALLEAMAAGKPIVSTEVGAIGSVVRHGESGLLVPPGDTSSLAGALSEMGKSAERAEKFGKAARRRYLSHHSSAAMGERYQALYEGRE